MEYVMNASFWHHRWEKNDIAFHEGKPNELLVKHFHELSLAKGRRPAASEVALPSVADLIVMLLNSQRVRCSTGGRSFPWSPARVDSGSHRATPFETTPPLGQVSSSALASPKYVEVTYGILLKGVGLEVPQDSVLAIGFLGSAFLGLGMRRFRTQLE
jgi:hypothetical protein